MVNGAVNNLGQAQAVVAAEGAINNSTMVRDLERTDGTKEIKKTDFMEKLLESGGTKDLTNQLLKDLMSKVAQAGIGFDKVAPESKTSQKKKETSETKSEYSDNVQLSDKQEFNLPVQGIGGKQEKYQGAKQEIATKWEEAKAELIKENKTPEQISRLEQQFKTSEMKKYMFNLLKDSAILYQLDSDTKISELIRRRGFSDLMERSGKELAKEAVAEAKSELRSFTLHELENQLILRTVLQDKNFKETYKLVDLGKKVGADTLTWMSEVWPRKKEDHGLSVLDVPHEVACFVDVQDFNSDARKDRGKYDYKAEDEKDLVLNRLRAYYMRLAINPGSSKSPKTWFEMRLLRNGLVRLGVYTQDLDDKVKEEARTLAKMKVMEMLDEALHERASLFDPEKDGMVDGKIKNCLKNLERLGFKLEESEFASLKDKANREMYSLIEMEKEKMKNSKGPEAEKRIQQLNKLMVRLRQESDLNFKEDA